MSVEPEPVHVSQDRTISGRLVVIGMFLFALVGVAFLQAYWNKHLEPFRPLQEALAKEFENSSPRVDGGQRKISKATPRVLRVVMRVPFDPEASENEQLVRTRINGVATVAREYVKLDDYEIFTTHFYQENPQLKKLKQETFETPIDELVFSKAVAPQ